MQLSVLNIAHVSPFDAGRLCFLLFQFADSNFCSLPIAFENSFCPDQDWQNVWHSGVDPEIFFEYLKK